MGETIWVQYKNDPNGVKWKASDRFAPDATYWYVETNRGVYFLPKCDYIPCAPSTRWVDVTSDCLVPDKEGSAIVHADFARFVLHYIYGTGYRLRKVAVASLPGVMMYIGNANVFVVEKEDPQ